MPAHRHLAYRRNAQAAAKKHKVRKSSKEELFQKARDDFGYFCEYVADKPPAKHHQEWHRQLVTNNNSSCLIKIAGPNIDLLGTTGICKIDCTRSIYCLGHWYSYASQEALTDPLP